MISIRKTITELDESQQQRDLAFDCYLAALRNIAHYTIEFDNSITEPYRRYVTSLAAEVSMAAPESLTESRGTLRGLLRDYRDKASHYLVGTARTTRHYGALPGGDRREPGTDRWRSRTPPPLRHRQPAASRASPEGAPLRNLLGAAVDTIQESIEQARREHQITVSQFKTEIRMLHKRIDMLETAACVDALTKMFTRREMEDRIRQAPPGAAVCC